MQARSSFSTFFSTDIRLHLTQVHSHAYLGIGRAAPAVRTPEARNAEQRHWLAVLQARGPCVLHCTPTAPHSPSTFSLALSLDAHTALGEACLHLPFRRRFLVY